MKLCMTRDGIARLVDDEVRVLALPHPDIRSLLADDISRAASAETKAVLPFDAESLLPLICQPENLVLIGLNYPSHVQEAKLPMPTEPTFILAPGGPLDPPVGSIRLPADAAAKVDYEGEIALIVGQTNGPAPKEKGWEMIAGVTIMNDVSERRAQFAAMGKSGWHKSALTASKRHRSFKPIGPVLVTSEEIGSQPDLRLWTSLNGAIVQDDHTSEMIFSFTEVVAAVSNSVNLRPGDVIATGTPAGVGMATRRYLQAGDLVEVGVDSIGKLSHRVVAPD